MSTPYKGSISYTELISLDDKVQLYRNVFGEAPWNEGYICPSTGQSYPLSYPFRLCECCQEANPLQVFYSPKELSESLRLLQKKEWYRETIATLIREKDPRSVVASEWDWDSLSPKGFMWWWKSDIDSINEEKLKLTLDQQKLLTENVQKISPSFDLNDFYYFAEIGISSSDRWSDIAWNLYRRQVASILWDGIKDILVRTTRTTDLPYKWFLKMWYAPVFEYNDTLDRVILAKTY